MAKRSKSRRNWEPDLMQDAIKYYQEQLNTDNPASIRDVAEYFGVPKSTLGDRLSGRVSSSPEVNPGPNPVLSNTEESKIVDYIKVCAQIGFGRTKQQILTIVGDIVTKSQAPNKFKNGKPGNDWWSGFLRRWPQVKLCNPQSLPRERAIALNPNVVKNYFALLHQILTKYRLLDKPERIYNADETGMPLDPKPPKVVKLVGQDAHTQTSGDKTNITVVACASAAGVLLPPQVIFKGKRGMDRDMFQGLPPSTRVCISPNGWIDSELFETWVTEHFVKHIPPARPVLLLIDGHSTHVRLDVARRCRENGIILFALPPHTTHKLQPLDRGCFKPLKDNFRREANEYVQEHPGKFLTRFVFGKIFGKVYAKSISPSTIINSFAKCGIAPYNPKVILESTDLAPSLVGNTEAQISCISDVDKALEAMGVFEPSLCTVPSTAASGKDIDPQPSTSSDTLVEENRVLDCEPESQNACLESSALSLTSGTGSDNKHESEYASVILSETQENENATESHVTIIVMSNDPSEGTEMFLSDISDCTNDIIYRSEGAISADTRLSENAIFPISSHCPQLEHDYAVPAHDATPIMNTSDSAVDSTLNESLCELLDKSKESVKPEKKKRKVIVNARALTEDEWFEKAEEEERKKREIEEEKERKKQERLEKKREKEALKLKKQLKSLKAQDKTTSNCSKKFQKYTGRTKNIPRTRKDVTLKKVASGPYQCPHCDGTYAEEKEAEIERLWVQCFVCKKWMHGDNCLPIGYFANCDAPFKCPACWD